MSWRERWLGTFVCLLPGRWYDIAQSMKSLMVRSLSPRRKSRSALFSKSSHPATYTCNRAVSKSNLPSATFITFMYRKFITFIYRKWQVILGGKGQKRGLDGRVYPVGHVACKGRSIPFFGRITRVMRTSCRQNRQFGTPKK